MVGPVQMVQSVLPQSTLKAFSVLKSYSTTTTTTSKGLGPILCYGARASISLFNTFYVKNIKKNKQVNTVNT